MRYWLRGGLISFSIFAVLIVLAMVSSSSDMGNIYHWILLVIGLPAFVLSYFINIGFGPFSGFFIMLFPYSFALGALIGWVIEKIKEKSK